MAVRRSPDFLGKVSSIQDNISSLFSPPDPTNTPSAPSSTPKNKQSAVTTDSLVMTTQTTSSSASTTTSSSSQNTRTTKSSSSTPTSSSSSSSSSSTLSTTLSSTSSSSSSASSSSSSTSSSTSSQKSSSTILSSSSHASSTSSTSALPAATRTPPATAHSSGPNGAKIALGIFGGIVALSLVLLAVFWMRRSKKNRNRAKQQQLIDELPTGNYQKMRDSNSDIHESPVFQDERDPDIRRQRLGAADAFPMTNAGAWGPQHDQQRNSFDQAGPAAEQLERPLPSIPRRATPNSAPAPTPQPYVAYKPFSQSYRPPEIFVAGAPQHQNQNRSPPDPTPSSRPANGISTMTPAGRRPPPQQGPDNSVFELPGQ